MRGLRHASAAVAAGLVGIAGVPAPAARPVVHSVNAGMAYLQVSQRMRVPEGVRDVAVAEDGTIAALGEQGSLFLAEARRNPRVLARLKDPSCVSICRDGRTVVCGYSDRGGRLSIWKAPRWDRPVTISTGEMPPVIIEMSRSAAIVTAYTGTGVRSWDTVKGEIKGPVVGWSAAAFTWSPGEDVLAAVDGDTEVDLYSRRAGWQRKVVQPMLAEVARERLVADGVLDFQQYQHRVAWSPDGRRIAVESSFTKSVRVYDAASGKLTYQSPPVDTYRTQALAWSGNGRSLVLADKAEVTRYSLAGRPPQAVGLPDPAGISAVALAPGGRWTALGYADGAVVVGAFEGAPR